MSEARSCDCKGLVGSAFMNLLEGYTERTRIGIPQVEVSCSKEKGEKLLFGSGS